LAAIDTAMNNAIIARVEQWAKDNQIQVGDGQIQDLHRRLDDHVAGIGQGFAAIRDEMKQLQAKVEAQTMPRDLRSVIRHEIQRENSEIQRVLSQRDQEGLRQLQHAPGGRDGRDSVRNFWLAHVFQRREEKDLPAH
jgi:predicted GIY-YIG superfamily endonuclease